MYIDLNEAVLESQMIKFSELCNVSMCMSFFLFFSVEDKSHMIEV